MKKLVQGLIMVSTIFLFTRCTDGSSNDDKVKQVDKDGSIEAVLTVKHLDFTQDALVIERTTWVKGKEYKKTITVDTIPSLGEILEDGEDSDGNDTSVFVPKNYQIFISVK